MQEGFQEILGTKQIYHVRIGPIALHKHVRHGQNSHA